MGELDAVAPLRNRHLGNPLATEPLEKAISRNHERFYTREGPFCAEIIKKKVIFLYHFMLISFNWQIIQDVADAGTTMQS